MSQDNSENDRSTEYPNDQTRENQATPGKGIFSGRTPLEKGLIGCFGLVLLCVGLGMAVAIVGVAAPLLIPFAIALIVLAFKRPNFVQRLAVIWPFRFLPASVTAGPIRFASILAAVVIPVSGFAGAVVYSDLLSNSKSTDSHQTTRVEAISTTALTPTSIVASIVELSATTPTPTFAQVTLTNPPAVPTSTTAEPIPTVTPPTPTASPPTPTPVPPTPTPEPPRMTADQQEYLADLYTKSAILAESSKKVSQLSQEVAQDSYLILDPSWRSDMAVQLGIWQGLYEASKDGTAPPGLEIINGKWIELLGHENLAADYIARGIDQIDASLINQGVDEMNTATDEVGELTQLLDDFTSQFE